MSAWKIDPSHTTVEFAVRHMGLATVRGQFTHVEGGFELADGLPQNIEITVDARSVHTREEQRDQHLRSADFFDVEHHPEIRFVGRHVESTGKARARVVGDLTIRGTTREVAFDVEWTDPVKDPWGARRLGVAATGSIDRKDWGLTWNQVLEFGGLLVGDQVRLSVDVEAVEQTAA